VVQKAFDICSLAQRKKMSDDVIQKANLCKFITDQNANHVVQKIIEKGYCDSLSSLKEDECVHLQPEYPAIFNALRPILEQFKNNAFDMSMHALGCRVIQKLLECFPPEDLKPFIYDEVMEHMLELSEDKYGN